MPRYLTAAYENQPRARASARRSDLHVAILVTVWLTIASGAVVFTEPAPVDALMLGVVVLLPVAALAVFTPGMLLLLAAWLIIAGTGLGAALLSLEVTKSVTHTAVTLYLSLAAVVLAAFIHKRPLEHTRLVMSAYLWSAILASGLGIAGYFNLFTGADDLFTSFGRARGAFKDPNVFGAYLVPPLIYAVQLWLARPLSKGVLPLGAILLISIALFLSFSRGAWINLAIALAIFGYLSFLLARSNWARLKIVAVSLICLALAGLVAGAALQFDAIADLAAQRMSLNQTYDQGPEGRFGGQLKALRLIADNPLGIGAGEFTRRHHVEEVHNVYLSMLLNNGWAGGILYAVTTMIVLGFGLRQLLRRTEMQQLLIVLWPCLLAVALEGMIIDSDHWRHFFLLLGLTWGLAEAARVTVHTRPVEGLSRRRIQRIAAAPSVVIPTVSQVVPPASAPVRWQILQPANDSGPLRSVVLPLRQWPRTQSRSLRLH